MRKSTKKIIFNLTSKRVSRDDLNIEYTFNILTWDEDGLVEMSKRV